MVASLRDDDDRSFDVEWRFSKYSLFLGQQLADEAEKEKVFTQGRDAGKIAMRLRPDRPEGHFWYGANLGELAKMSPASVGLRSVDEIRKAMSKVIELDRTYQGASAYVVLAEVEMKTRFLGGGKASQAVAFLETAAHLSPNNSRTRLHLAEAYLAVDRDAEAKRQLEELINMQPDPNYAVEHEAAVAEARKIIAERFD